MHLIYKNRYFYMVHIWYVFCIFIFKPKLGAQKLESAKCVHYSFSAFRMHS